MIKNPPWDIQTSFETSFPQGSVKKNSVSMLSSIGWDKSEGQDWKMSIIGIKYFLVHTWTIHIISIAFLINC